MPCVCANTTLQLFIQSVARLDISCTTKLSLSNPLLRSSATSFKSKWQVHSQCFSVGRSTTLPLRSKYLEGRCSESVASNSRYLRTSSRQCQEATDARLENHSSSPPEGAILELSVENIDALIANIERDSTVPLDQSVGRSSIEKSGRGLSQHGKPTKTRGREKENETPSAPSSPRTPRGFSRISSQQDSRPYLRGPRQGPYREERRPHPQEPWQIQKEALNKKFPDGWMPQKRLSPDALAGIRALHAQEPSKYTTKMLAESFEVSAEAIRRILKSKWVPDSVEESDRARRWVKRGQEVWSRKAELGLKPPRMWRDMGIGSRKPEWKKRKLPPLITTSRRAGAFDPGSS